jgi:putative multiple sugar transport system permease protein
MSTTANDPAAQKKKGGLSDIRKIFGGGQSSLRQFGILGSLIVIIVIFQIWTNGLTLSPTNLINVVNQYSYILILAIGMVMVIIMGHIDLSVGSVAAFTGIIVAKSMADWNLPWPLAIVLGIVVGVAIGAWQGFWVAFVGVPAFIVTLAGMLLFRGGTQILLQGQSIAPFPKGFQKNSSGFLPEVGPHTNYHNLTLLLGLVLIAAGVWQEVRDRRRQQEFALDVLPARLFLLKLTALVAAILVLTLLLASYKGAPIILIVLGALVVGYGYIMRNAVFGRHIYAIGGNLPAAKLSGVKDKKVTFYVFLNMGVLAALAGLVVAARLNAASPKAGVNFELEAIASSFIGGASMSGGVGTVLGAIIGGLVLGVLNNGMNLLSVGTDWQQVIKGLALLVAVGFDVWNKRKSGS